MKQATLYVGVPAGFHDPAIGERYNRGEDAGPGGLAKCADDIELAAGRTIARIVDTFFHDGGATIQRAHGLYLGALETSYVVTIIDTQNDTERDPSAFEAAC